MNDQEIMLLLSEKIVIKDRCDTGGICNDRPSLVANDRFGYALSKGTDLSVIRV
jgi:hypothetical protein